MGCPEPPTREQTKLLREACWGVQREILEGRRFGNFSIGPYARALDCAAADGSFANIRIYQRFCGSIIQVSILVTLAAQKRISYA